jgi:hypothetical protein
MARCFGGKAGAGNDTYTSYSQPDACTSAAPSDIEYMGYSIRTADWRSAARACLAAWLPGYLAGWLPGCLAAWLAGWLPACLPACLPASLAAWLPAWLPACLLRLHIAPRDVIT